ncbi:hypothetical protein GCM10023321_69950 [Pseudonocardia eucalypti]|uniref:Uncharacterized protein n=2 Tax=Pseudonocardia eucalypti TaxID=648755 RepID=A0ABP9R4I1_9PSEU
MRILTATLLAAALVVPAGAAAPVQPVAASVPSAPAAPEVKVEFGWFVYLKFTKDEVRTFAPLLKAESKAAPALICKRVPPGKARDFCAKGVKKYMGKVADTWRKAAEKNQCVEHKYLYAPVTLVSWKAYDCGGRGGSW